MKKLYLALIGLLFNSAYLFGQTTLATSPPLAVNNGSSAVTFEVTTATPIIITGIANTFNAAAIACDVWYRPGGVLVTGQTSPAVSTANGWILAQGAATFTSTSNTTPTAIPYTLNIPVNPGTPVGICINAYSGGTRYVSYAAANQINFTNGTATINTYNNANGQIIGHGGTITSWIASRQFAGSITYNIALPCTNPVNGGTTVSNVPAVCPTGTATLSLSGATNGLGSTFQWQSSPNGTTWTNIAGATTASYNASQTSDTYYQCIVTCSGGTPATSTPLLLPMNPFYNCYCNSNATSVADEEIFNVTFGSLNNSSTCSTTGGPGSTLSLYSDFTTTVAPAYVFYNQVVPLSVQVGTCGGNFGNWTKVWIDYNHNGSFTDPGEQVYSSSAATTGPHIESGNVTIPATALPGTTRMRVVVVETTVTTGVNPCGTYTWGETEDYLISIAPPPVNDAGVAAITRPQIPACTLGDSIFVTLNNAGTNPLTSCVLNWSINGIAQSSGSFTGSVAPGAVSSEVFVGTGTLNAGDVIKVWTSGPNNVPDSFAGNDTIQGTLLVAMYGNYTIGGVNPDFPTFNAAVSALVANGVCDDVTFIVYDTTYVEQVSIPNILGTNANATITFQSASGIPENCILTQTNAPTNFVVKFNGADWVTFKNMSIINSSPTNGIVLDFTASANYNTLDNVNLITDTLFNSTSTTKCVVYVNGTKNEFNTIKNSRLKGGSYSIYWFGSSTTNLTKELTIENNEITHYYYRSIYLYYHDSPKIRNNYFYSDKNYTSQYTIMNYYCDNAMEITGNRIIGNTFGAPLYAMYLYYCDGSPVNKSTIANNMIAMGETNLSNAFYGMLMYYSGNSRIANNSINILGTSASQRGLQVGYGGLIDIMNNNINVQSGMTIYSVDAYTIANSDYNNLRTTGATFSYFGVNQTDLAAWQAATNQDAHSMSVDPQFFGPKDLHVCSSDLDNAGISLAYITEDVDGELRQSIPDIGADEFSSVAKFTAGDDFVLCDGATADLMASMNFDDTTIWMGSDTTHIYTVSAAGTYTVSSSNTCGVAYDTLEVMEQQHAALQNDTLICPGDQILVDANVANGTYTWSNGEATQSITISQTGTYSVTVVDADGCSSTDNLIVQQPAGVDLPTDTTFCAGSSIFVDAGIQNASYSWSNGLPNAQIVSVNSTGIYSVTVTDINGCVSTDAIDVTAIPQPDATFTSTVSFATFIGNVTNPYAGATYNWDFGDGNSATGINVTHIYNAEGQFAVILTVANECGTANSSFQADINVGVEEAQNGNFIKVFPNPTSGVLNFAATASTSEPMTIEVLDLQGRLVFTKTSSMNTIANEQVDISFLANGIYTIKITKDNSVDTFKVTLQK